MKVGDDHDTGPMACLACGDVLDRAREIANKIEGNPPTPGEFSICFHCGHIMAFNELLNFRELTEEEVLEIASNSEIQKMKRIITKFRVEMDQLKPN